MKTDLYKETEHTGVPRLKLDKKARGESGKDNANPYRMPPKRWFFTFMCINTPVARWAYLICPTSGKKENQLRDSAKAYLTHKSVLLAAALIVLGVLVYTGLDLVDKLLARMEIL